MRTARAALPKIRNGRSLLLKGKQMADYYPTRLTDLIPWHANFAVEATASGTTHGLTAGEVTQAGEDSNTVALLVNYSEAVDQFRQEVTEFRDAVLRGDPLLQKPTAPVAPATLTLGLAALPGIEARTREFSTRIKASSTYTTAVGEAYGIVGTSPAQGTPSVAASPLTGSQVRLRIGKSGFSVLAVDSRRGGGAWEQIGVSQTAEFIDTRAPLVAGQPEQREYRVQGMLNNARTGDPSDIVSVVTTP
ncbi:MAG: hypothetical protein WD716_12815 [Fimbriimonadaceae bacterium]